ncbi:hypothetical protein [Mycoplasmoides gallisepticum]|uniref:hypothetical protein n=1 Tax=Mycoplasmoides gallisepticum TaxID=2096 RepID=UPI001247CE7E|nr:hypothetical protein [Mycoplasmoides gallisepticum]QEX45653.1 hypothetical protein F6J65_00550 [Mycoplasmoides gallisepticum]
MNKIFKLLNLGLLTALLPIVIASCTNDNSSEKIRMKSDDKISYSPLPRLFFPKAKYVDDLEAALAKYDLSFSDEQEQNFEKFDLAKFNKLDSQLTKNANEIYRLQKQIAETSISAEVKAEKHQQILVLFDKNSALLSDNIMAFFKYIYNFRMKFYDYALLTDSFKNNSENHSARYLHFALNVNNQFANDNLAAHIHFRYNRSITRVNIVGTDLKTSMLVDSELREGYRVMYVSLSNVIFKLYVSNDNKISLDSRAIFFSGAIGNIDPQETLDAMEKNPEKLTQFDIENFENKFTALPYVKYPQINSIF